MFFCLDMKLTSLQSEITRHEEAVFNSKEHKEFLDKLASKEWHEQKQKKRNEIIERAREDFIQKELQNYDEDKDENESQNAFYQQRTAQRTDKQQRQPKTKSLVSIREAAEEKFNQLLKDGEM